MIDAYDQFFEKYPKEQFFKDALEQIIFIEDGKIDDNWKELKRKLLNVEGNDETLYIRGHGRDALGTNKFKVLYSFYLKI